MTSEVVPNFQIGQIYLDDEGLRWEVRAISRTGWPIIVECDARKHLPFEADPTLLASWTLEER